MSIAGLVLAILSVSVFFWAGPTLGGLWSASSAVSSSLSGQAAVLPTMPIWVMGISLGVGMPAISLFLSIGGMMKKQPRGIGIAGIVISCVGMILGFITTLGTVFALNIASAAKDKFDRPAADLQQMQNTLDNPAFQSRILQAMETAKQNPPAGSPADAPPARPSTAPTPADTLMPGQAPAGAVPNPAGPAQPAEAQPAEAPLSQNPK